MGLLGKKSLLLFLAYKYLNFWAGVFFTYTPLCCACLCSSPPMFSVLITDLFDVLKRHCEVCVGLRGQMLCPLLRDALLRSIARCHHWQCSLWSLSLEVIGWVVSFAGIRRLCAWVRSNIVRRRVDWSGMARYKHCFVYA